MRTRISGPAGLAVLAVLCFGTSAVRAQQLDDNNIDHGKKLSRSKEGLAAEDRLTRKDIQDAGQLRDKAARFHVLELEKGEKVQVDLKSKDFDAYLYIIDGRSKILAENDDGPGTGLDSQITFTAPARGRYRLIASTLPQNATGNYRISVKFLGSDERGTAASARGRPFQRDDNETLSVTDRLTEDETEDRGVLKGKSAKSHTIQLAAGEKVQIDLMSKDFDCYLYLTDSKGKVLDQNDDGGEGLNSRITFTSPARGTYKLIATSFAKNATGRYRMTVRTLEAPKAAIVFDPRNEGKDMRDDDGVLSVSDSLTRKDIEEGAFNGKAAKYHEVRLRAGERVRIDLMSKDFDSYLIVTDRNGRLLAQDDDGGEGLNARLFFTAPTAGRYKLIATTFGEGMVGRYRMTVQPARGEKKDD